MKPFNIYIDKNGNVWKCYDDKSILWATNEYRPLLGMIIEQLGKSILK